MFYLICFENPYCRFILRWICCCNILLCAGLPLLVVIVVISELFFKCGLLTPSSCWLRNDITFYAGVVAYFTLVFALCLLVFILVMVQLARIKKQNPQNQSPDRGVLTDLRSVTGLAILLGLTWGFALFAWGPLRLPFTYLFSIFNSLQGKCSVFCPQSRFGFSTARPVCYVTLIGSWWQQAKQGIPDVPDHPDDPELFPGQIGHLIPLTKSWSAES
uniref:G-protein coupled receptors family 2 profile 2 domain-containing protein n=1 Tax=Mola mola TaxID=94237 RepID=A0A3Q4AL13_MOLML